MVICSASSLAQYFVVLFLAAGCLFVLADKAQMFCILLNVCKHFGIGKAQVVRVHIDEYEYRVSGRNARLV